MILEATRSAIEKVLDTAKLEHKREELDERLEGTLARIRSLIERNAREAMEQDAFLAEHKSLSDHCAALTAEIEKVDERISEMRGRKAAIDEYLAALEQAHRLPVEFSRRLWNMTVERLTVHKGKRLVFLWKDGTTGEYWRPRAISDSQHDAAGDANNNEMVLRTLPSLPLIGP